MITKQINSKANIKQYSNADYPINPKYPVLARHHEESTVSQTVINLPFSIDTINNAEALILTVDGKTFSPGASNDYTFTAIDSLGFSSQITLTSALAAGLNIQAIKLGLKKESELARTVLSINSNQTLINNTIVLVDTSASRTLTLPSATRNALITIKDSTGSANTNNITVNPTAGLIDGAASLTMNTSYQFVSLVSDGTNWFKV